MPCGCEKLFVRNCDSVLAALPRRKGELNIYSKSVIGRSKHSHTQVDYCCLGAENPSFIWQEYWLPDKGEDFNKERYPRRRVEALVVDYCETFNDRTFVHPHPSIRSCYDE